jgi:tRNA 2-thiouridine synthesizing protein A
MDAMRYDRELNCRGLNCPLPVLKTKKAIDEMGAGQVLKLIATDPGSVNDMNAWTRRTGNELLQHQQEGSDFVFYVRKK